MEVNIPMFVPFGRATGLLALSLAGVTIEVLWGKGRPGVVGVGVTSITSPFGSGVAGGDWVAVTDS